MYILHLIVLAASAFMLEETSSNMFYSDMVKNNKCVMFVRKNCWFSKSARDMALENNILCKIIIADDNKNAEEFSKQYKSTFPNIFLDGSSIGGFNEFNNRNIMQVYPFNHKPFDPNPRHISIIDKII
ncbi:hypothetical protein HK407_09g15090 [Ordospora pajunii]|uniref:uncharacterized protein n=1 Tax=Ordospora pajunii TaxID=3039483 RepID=UPI0029527941|nr:uncharacterized protein HK407_09g15090 [Ordospora pajunii]KAH9410914.1 hypothetical protein HK407_09g15090 [Ordospora pajunii]